MTSNKTRAAGDDDAMSLWRYGHLPELARSAASRSFDISLMRSRSAAVMT
jgi:hypothetical protein